MGNENETTAIPSGFKAEMAAQLGASEAAELLAALQTTPPVGIRLNPSKFQRVANAALPERRVPWSSWGFCLDSRPQFTFDPLLHAGAYYVQEPSSMAVELALRQVLAGMPVRALDLCAAPGGKSTLLASLLPQGSLLVCNEPVRQRTRVLLENVRKWGSDNAVVTASAPADFGRLGAFFDVVLADVPCSGEGMFRKDHAARGEWSADNVRMCAERQQCIVSDVWPALKEGGYMVYSTCTFNAAEDEANVAYICNELGAEIVDVPAEGDWGIEKKQVPGCEGRVCHFYPHRLAGEGFFLALLRKTAGTRGKEAAIRLKGKRQQDGVPAQVKRLLKDFKEFDFRIDGSEVAAVAKQNAAVVDLLRQRLDVVSSGVSVAAVRGRKMAASSALVLNEAYERGSLPEAELDYQQAIAFLRGETLTFPPAVANGIVAVAYRGLPLGVVNNLGSRANNLFPSAWRIRSGHVPAEVRVL